MAWRDLLPWTKESCKTCLGRGVVTRLIGQRAAERTRQTTVCKCAIKRFEKVQKTHWQNGQLFAVEPFLAVSKETMENVMDATEKKYEQEQAEAAAKAESSKAPESIPETTVIPEGTDEPAKDGQ